MTQPSLFADLPSTSPPEVAEEALPKSLQELADAGVTLETIRLLVEALGGARHSIPKSGTTHCAVTEALGEKRATELARKAGGRSVYIPACYRWAQAQRNRALLADYETGMRPSEICRKYAISEPRLRQILAG